MQRYCLSLVHVLVVVARIDSRSPRWDHDDLAGFEQRFDHPGLCIVGFVGQYSASRGAFEQNVRPFEVMVCTSS